MSTTNDQNQSVTGCVRFASLFQNALLEDPPNSSAPVREQRRYAALTARAGDICAACPLRSDCLYEAVVGHDVSGFVAGTTERQRVQIRRRLGVQVAAEDFDTLAGATAPHRQVDHHEVVRLRKANPDETLESIAQRLGCSLSTVKRHLRRDRAERTETTAVAPLRRRQPTLSQVLDAAAAVVEPVRRQLRRAA